jgi:hypothetical protein
VPTGHKVHSERYAWADGLQLLRTLSRGSADTARQSRKMTEMLAMAASADGVAMQSDRKFTARAHADVARYVPQELIGIELAAKALDVGAVLAQ